MYATVEEKLSAMKAINDEKDLMEQYLSRMASVTQTTHGHANYFINGHVLSFLIPTEVAEQLNVMLSKYYTTRRDLLITKATELMK